MSKIQAAIRRIQAGKVLAPESRRSQAPDDDATINQFVEVLHVDLESLQNDGMIAPESQKLQFENQYREIKRPLIALAFGKRATLVAGGRLVMITSAVAGEGKTSISINLAMSLAQELDYSVLLIDADVAKPHITGLFQLEDKLGLLDLLENEHLKPSELIVTTDIPGISVLPAGAPRSMSAELLSGLRMDEVVARFLEDRPNRLIIMDSPPLLETNEAKILAALAGQILLVVKAGETSQEAVHAALATVPEGKAVNLILNQVRDSMGGRQYAYGYGQAKKDDGTDKVPQQQDDWG